MWTCPCVLSVEAWASSQPASNVEKTQEKPHLLSLGGIPVEKVNQGEVETRIRTALPSIGVYRRLVFQLANLWAALPYHRIRWSLRVTHARRARPISGPGRLSRYLAGTMRYAVSLHRSASADYPFPPGCLHHKKTRRLSRGGSRRRTSEEIRYC